MNAAHHLAAMATIDDWTYIISSARLSRHERRQEVAFLHGRHTALIGAGMPSITFQYGRVPGDAAGRMFENADQINAVLSYRWRSSPEGMFAQFVFHDAEEATLFRLTWEGLA